MNRVRYDPEKYPRLPMPYETREVLRSLGEGIQKGAPAPDNPFGLYRIVEQGQGWTARTLLLPYEADSMDNPNYLDACVATDTKEATPYDAYAGLVVGGLLKYLHDKNDHIALTYARHSPVVAFGISLTFRIVHKLAVEHLSANPTASIAELVDIIERSYPHTAEMIMRLKKDEAHAAEHSLELNHFVGTERAIGTHIFSTREDGLFEITPPVASLEDPILCPVHYLKDDTGNSVEQITLRRALSLAIQMPELFEADIERAQA